MKKLEKIGSKTAKEGFKNEKDIVKKFNHWQTDQDAQKWLKIMGYQLEKVEKVKAMIISGVTKLMFKFK